MTHAQKKLSDICESQERVILGVAEPCDYADIERYYDEYKYAQVHTIVNLLAILATAIAVTVGLYFVVGGGQ